MGRNFTAYTRILAHIATPSVFILRLIFYLEVHAVRDCLHLSFKQIFLKKKKSLSDVFSLLSIPFLVFLRWLFRCDIFRIFTRLRLYSFLGENNWIIIYVTFLKKV